MKQPLKQIKLKQIWDYSKHWTNIFENLEEMDKILKKSYFFKKLTTLVVIKNHKQTNFHRRNGEKYQRTISLKDNKSRQFSMELLLNFQRVSNYNAS